MYYSIINNGLIISENQNILKETYGICNLLPEDYTEGKYIVENNELVLNENYEEEQKQKEYERLQELSMTRSDFFDGTIQAWGVGQDELLVLIQTILTTIPIDNTKELMAINNFRNALNFYRKHDLFKMIVNIPIQLSETVQVLILDEHLDKFFDEVNKGNKETAWQYLPQPVATPIETNEEGSEVDGEVVDGE